MESDHSGGVRWRDEWSAVDGGCKNLLLTELLNASTVWCSGWNELSMTDFILANILLPPTTSMESGGRYKAELALLTSLFSHFLSLSMLPPPQQNTDPAQCRKMIEVVSSAPPKDLSLLSRWRRLWPFLYRASMFSGIQGIFRLKFNPWSNILWHQVRPPSRSLQTTSLCSFSNLRKDRTLTIHCSLRLQQDTAIQKAIHSHKYCSEQHQTSATVQKRVPAHSSRHQTSAGFVRFLLQREHNSALSCSSMLHVGKPWRVDYWVQLEMLNSVLFPVSSW